MNLDIQRTRFCLIVGADFFNNDNLSYLNILGCQYAYILHNNDFNDNGEKKNSHYHIVLSYKDRKRGKQVLNKVADILDCTLDNIQIDECHNFIASIQYLLHKNAPNKTQYCIDDIRTNYTYEMLESYLNSDIESKVDLTFSTLIDIITSCTSRIEIIKKIGIGNYQCYRTTINDILDEMRKKNEES